MRWQRKRTDQSHGALVLHLETILCAVRQKNIILFKVGCHARNRNTTFHHPSQLITYYLTTTSHFNHEANNDNNILTNDKSCVTVYPHTYL